MTNKIRLTTQEDLVEFLKNYKSPTTAVFSTKTLVKLNKKDVATKSIANPFKEVFKVSVFKGEVNFDYEEKVNDQRFMEGKTTDFESQEHKWGTHVAKSILEKNGSFYMSIIPGEKIIDASYEDEEGNEVKYEDIKPFVPNYSGATKQNLDDEVKFRSYKLDSIFAIDSPKWEYRTTWVYKK